MLSHEGSSSKGTYQPGDVDTTAGPGLRSSSWAWRLQQVGDTPTSDALESRDLGGSMHGEACELEGTVSRLRSSSTRPGARHLEEAGEERSTKLGDGRLVEGAEPNQSGGYQLEHDGGYEGWKRKRCGGGGGHRMIKNDRGAEGIQGNEGAEYGQHDRHCHGDDSERSGRVYQEITNMGRGIEGIRGRDILEPNNGDGYGDDENIVRGGEHMQTMMKPVITGIQVEERRGTNRLTSSEEDFKTWIHDMGLVDLLITDRKFTWFRGRSCSRIDRALVSLEWLEEFPETRLRGGPRGLSDHCPIIVEDKRIRDGPRPFRSLDSWFTHEGRWHKDKFGDMDKKIMTFEEEIKKIDDMVGDGVYNGTVEARRRALEACCEKWYVRKE
ncbi:uncharacterized protein DS421_2g57130 [Arachis hypogaea]|nr:uncharacterized protein DS421_2g57130 [Arachis hypogaea]